MNLYRWLYQGGRPNWLAMLLNRCSAELHSLGVAPNYAVTSRPRDILDIWSEGSSQLRRTRSRGLHQFAHAFHGLHHRLRS